MGVDPGSRIAGFGVIQIVGSELRHLNHGVVALDAEMPFAERMTELGKAFRELMLKYQPQEVVIEKIFLGKNADSAFKLGHARGVIMYEAGLAEAKVFEYATRVVKKSVTGNGGAEKTEVQAVLQALLGLRTIQRVDASDALAMACHHAFELKKRKLIEKAIQL